MKKILFLIPALVLSVTIMAEDHVMAAAKSAESQKSNVGSPLSLSLKEAQDFAVKQNRSL